MRVTQSEIYRDFNSDLGNLNETYSKLNRQVSSGKALTQLSDSPSGAADLLSLTDIATYIDQYQSSAETVSYFLKTADSALNEVNNLLTSLVSKGSQASSEVLGDEERATLAMEIRSMRDQILSLANSQVKGKYIFAGSSTDSEPFQISGDDVSYNGDSTVNSVQVEEGTEVTAGIAGSEAFTSIFSTIGSLLSAIDSNDTEAIGTALTQFESAYSQLGLARGRIGSSMSTIENVQSRLAEQETNLKERRSQIEDTDMTEAVVQLGQLKTTLDAALSAGSSILSQRNLFDILG
jgi:flagellar hook-associated protein 3 FlgL